MCVRVCAHVKPKEAQSVAHSEAHANSEAHSEAHTARIVYDH